MIKHYKFQDLGTSDLGWLNAKYHFNFGNYFNPNIKPKLPLLVWNDDTIKPNTGFPMHPHKNMEIITYVREGSIKHKDNLGNSGIINANQIQVMSAGYGVNHSEFNHSNKDTILFQIWIQPYKNDICPRWETISLENDNSDSLTVFASGEKKYANKNILKINQDASLIKVNGLNENINYKLGKNRHVYFVLSNGKAIIDGYEINKRDGVYISCQKKFNLKFLEKTELIMVDMPYYN